MYTHAINKTVFTADSRSSKMIVIDIVIYKICPKIPE
jgi:hypothetical protein